METTGRVVLITGASSGIGEACARHLARHGFRVFGTSRRGAEGADGGGYEMVAMDVDSDASVENGVAEVVRRAGRIDAVVNNAGWALAGALEDTPTDEARAQMETNLFGVWRVCRAVLPAMRAAGGGYIVNIGSIGGRVGLPFQAAYSASKFAVAGLTEALSGEVRPFGIHTVLVEPGNYRTAITSRRRLAADAGKGSAYGARFTRTLEIIERDEERGSPPDEVARLVHRILRTRSPKMRYMVGPLGERLATILGQSLLPRRAFERVVMRLYGIE
jgi:NAD(P)-dependent dehydrogenase (short-subunit alcohol dehydrogenase family)